MNSELVVSGFSKPVVTINTDALDAKAKAIEAAKTVTVVTDAGSQELAISAMKCVKALLNGVEKTRKLVKDPVLLLGKEIDAKASEYAKELDLELSRITRLVEGYQASERKKAEELRRQEQERLDNIRREEEAKLEELRKKQEAASPKKQVAIQAQIDRTVEKAGEQIAKSESLIMTASPSRADGQVVKEGYDYEVTDVLALYRAYPRLCRIEPNKAEIRSAIDGGMKQCPGLVITPRIKVGVRL